MDLADVRVSDSLEEFFLSAELVELNHKKTQIDYFCWKFTSVFLWSCSVVLVAGVFGGDFGVVNVTTPLPMYWYLESSTVRMSWPSFMSLPLV